MKWLWLVTLFSALSAFADGGWVSVAAPVVDGVDGSSVTSRVCVPLTPEEIAALRPGALPRSMSPPVGQQAGLPAADDNRIRGLVRGLDFDWRKCFRFVRDNIVFSPSPGYLRGPERTLVDREGSDVDQAYLLKAMLSECGVNSDVVYFSADGSEGSYALPLHSHGALYPVNACSWLGVLETGAVSSLWEKVSGALASAGRQVSLFENLGADGRPLFVATDHFMLIAEVDDGSRMLLDPSLKAMKPSAPADPLADSGYSRSQLLSASGVSAATDCASGASQAAIDAYLNARSAALRSAWTNASASAYIGSKRIIGSSDEDVFVHGDVYRSPEFVSDWTMDRRNTYRARATLSFGSAVLSFHLDELGTRRLWLSFEQSQGMYPRAVLHLDDAVIASEAAGADASSMHFETAVTLRGEETRSSATFLRSVGSVYSIIVGFSDGGRGRMRSLASSEVAAARSAGLSDASPAMLSRTLHLAGHEWLSQVGRLARFANDLVDFPLRDFYSVGVAGYSGSLFVDFGNRCGCSPEVNNPDVSTLFASALEHAVLEQLMGYGTSAVSTMKIFNCANANGDSLYAVDSGNWSRVQSRLIGYTQTELDAFGGFVASGGHMALPRSGLVSVDGWTGGARVMYLSSGARLDTGMMISGGLNGGYCTANDLPSAVAFDDATANARFDDGSVAPSFSADPVAMPSGAFMDAVVDLSLDSGAPLAWSRTYDSRLAHSDGALGRGWRHGFEVSVAEGADADAVFGGGSAAAAVPTALAYMVVRDLLDGVVGLSHGEQARRWLVASCVVDWWTRRHTGATVSVSDGARVVNFQRLEDGAYAPPPGVTDSLCRSNGVFVLSRRLGSSCIFNSSNRIASIVDRSGNQTIFAYASGRLRQVRNSFGASLLLGWRAERIYQVMDSAGRSVRYTYDRNGCLTDVRDPEGGFSSYEYDADGLRLTRTVDADGSQIVANEYDGFGRVTNQVSAIGGVTRFGYAENLLSWSVDPLGGRKEESFDESGRLLTSVDCCGAKTVRSYDDRGHEVSVVDALGRSVHSAYDGLDRLTVVGEGTDALHRLRRWGYDSRHRMIAETNALNGVTACAYDDRDRPLVKTRPDGSSEAFAWDSRGLLAGHELRSASGEVVFSVTNAYDASGRLVMKSVGGRGLDVSNEALVYDEAGNVISRMDANGNVTRFGYDRCGRMTSATDALGGVRANEYSAAGRLTSSVDELGRRTVYRYSASGKVASVVYPDGAWTTNVYDAADRLIRSVDERGRAVEYSYDAEGRMVASCDAFGTNVVVRDVLGRATAETNAVGFAESVSYDDLDHVTSRVDRVGSIWRSHSNCLGWTLAATNPLGRVTRYSYNRVGDRIGFRRPSGATERFGRDVNGNVVAHTNAENHVTVRAFDGLGRQLSEVDACGRLRFTNRYDRVGNLVARIDGEGHVTACDYDALNRLVRSETQDDVETFAYDPVGNLVSAANSVVAESFAYDLRDRLISTSLAVGTNGFHFVWRRDAGGLVTNLVCGVEMSVAKTYDLRGRLTSLRDGFGHEWTFAYDAENRLVGGTSPDGVNRSLAYDGCGRVTAWSVGSLAGRTITRDATGRRIRDDVTAGSMPTPSSRRLAQNVFDAADRLVSAQVEYGGNAFTESYLHDGNGAITNILSDGELTFCASYDASGRLASLGTNGWHCAYDALGNRIRMGERIFVPDYDDPLKRPLLECTVSGTIIRRYLWGPTGLLGFIDADDELTVAHSDEQGSVIALTDIDGNVLFRANYGPSGEDWGSSGTNPTPFAWLGGLGVMRVGTTLNPPLSTLHSPLSTLNSPLYLTRHRLYSPVLRRFLSSDPLGFAGGANVYLYANGNPLAYVDPLGLCAEDGGLLVRIGGFFQMLGGAFEAVAGYTFAVGTAETCAGFAAGMAVGLHGTDVACAGCRTMVDGAAYDSMTSRLLQTADVPQDWANGIDVGISVVGSAGVGLAARTATQSGAAIQAYYPPNGGAVGNKSYTFLYKGTFIDRYGGGGESRYFSPVGTPAEMRAMPPCSNGEVLRTFQVEKPFEVEQSVVAPAFNQLGLGIQYKAPVKLDVMLEHGIIREVR